VRGRGVRQRRPKLGLRRPLTARTRPLQRGAPTKIPHPRAAVAFSPPDAV
jgi:hypothetical protein